jgi:sterol desaturase/sphingolipid hydroxylase (fatty acid hydroxylase superfamily)
MEVLASETSLRFAAFFGIFAVLALCEVAAPARDRLFARRRRWVTNWVISALNAAVTALMALGLGLAAALAAVDAGEHGIGLFNRLAWPGWLEGLIVFVVLDFAIWLQHLVSHRWGPLWRLHRVHHVDREIDVTTGIRFHPVEIALSMLWKIALVYALGASLAAVIAFEIVLNGSTMFNHSNIRLPAAVERWLRLAIVTPDMHRVHHSIDRREHDSNYGFNLSVWDRLFRTYVPQPRLGHRGMVIGLAPHQTDEPVRIGWSLLFAFRP